MPRYILIDNDSGFVWADSAEFGRRYRGTPFQFARRVDEALGEFGRTYITVHRSMFANASGYHVYTAPSPKFFPLVNDGQDQATIESVLKSCSYLCTIKCIPAGGEP